MINVSYFHDLLESMGIGKPLLVHHLQIYISCPCRRAPLFCPVLILACLTGVSALVVYLCQYVAYMCLVGEELHAGFTQDAD